MRSSLVGAVVVGGQCGFECVARGPTPFAVARFAYPSHAGPLRCTTWIGRRAQPDVDQVASKRYAAEKSAMRAQYFQIEKWQRPDRQDVSPDNDIDCIPA